MRNLFLQKHQSLSIIIALVVLTLGQNIFAQSTYQPYSYSFYQKFSTDLYSTKTRIHTTLKPFFTDDSLLIHTYDSLMNYGVDSARHDLLYRKIFNEHLIDLKRPGYTLYADGLPDLQIGKDFSDKKNTWLTTLGYQVGGTIGTKFFFYGSAYHNRAVFPQYITDYANRTGIVPSQTANTSQGNQITDWAYFTGLLSYTPVKYINFTLGKDKTFIGDGYRSMLLSDYASNYPFLKLTLTLGNVRYMSMYAYLDNPGAPKLPNGNTRPKWGYFQYVDWNVSNRVSLGFFQNVMETISDAAGQKRGFNPSLASPFVILFPLTNIDNNPVKNLLGFTGKYKVFNKTILYGQFSLNEFRSQDFFSTNGSVTNKSGIQLGFRGADLLHIKGFNYLAEFNTARPYAYASYERASSYSQDDEPLAHPLGANFREWLSVLNYSAGRFDFQGQLNYAYYGQDIGGLNYGKDIFKRYTDAAKQYGNFTGQGLRTDFYYAEGRIAYLLNPKYNLRLELGGVYRNEKNNVYNNKTSMLTIGLRSSFRNLYYDF